MLYNFKFYIIKFCINLINKILFNPKGRNRNQKTYCIFSYLQFLFIMKSKQSLIGNRYLYSPQQPLRKSQNFAQYRTYDKVTKRDLLLQIHQKNDFIIDSLRQHKHAFILYIFDKVEMDDGRVSYVFQSGVQATLQQALRKVKHLNQQDALVIFKHILILVKQIHQKQIICERLCLNNIFICNYALLKLGHTVFQSDLPMQYWSPQRLQDKQVSPQSDIYSLGVLLYKMLYGVFPFTADSQSQMIKKIKSKKLQVSQTKSPLGIVISRQVHFLIASMLDFYQENRPDLGAIMTNSLFSFEIQTDLQKYVKPKGSIVPEPFHKKYLVFRPSKIVTKYSDYYSQSAYLIFNANEKNFMTLYIPDVRMFQTQPRKIQSYYQKIKALQKNYKRNGCEYLVKVDDIERFRQEPIIATEYSNQGNLFTYLEKRKVFKGWLSEAQTNVLMYLMAIALKQMKTMGIQSVHTINHQRIMIHNNNIKLRQPGILTPIIQKKLQGNQQIDFFAPQLKQKLDFVELDKSDIWSYGVTYYYLLSGQLPKIGQQNQIDLSILKTNKKNMTIIGKCLDYNVKKRIELQNIKMQNIYQSLLHDMIIQNPAQDEQQNVEKNDNESIDPNMLLDYSDVDSNAEEIKQNKKVMFKRRKKRLFKHYNKIIAQSTTTPCRLLIKTIFGLIILWLLFFGIFFLNGGVGLLRTNFYRKITLQVPYNYGTSLYNLSILTTDGKTISQQYPDYSYQQFTKDLRCAQNRYSKQAVTDLYDFANSSQTIFCLFGFVWAILISILYAIQTHKQDLPTILVKRKVKASNKELYHYIFMHFILPALMFTFWTTFAFQYIMQTIPCFGIQNLAYPKMTSVEAILNGDMSKFFLNIFLTVVVWAILMLAFGYSTLLVKKVNAYVYQWIGIIPSLSIMFLYTLICRVGFGSNAPIQPSFSYKMNLDITSKHYGFFGFFPQALWLVIIAGGILIDFLFWVFLKIGLTPNQQEDITRVAVVKAKFQKLQTKQKDPGNQKSNIYMIENAYDFERFD